MPRYILYARKSTESEDRQVLSIDSQLKELQSLARNRGLEIADVLQESRSAKAPGRPVFTDVLRRLTRERVTGVLCWKLDRLARNPVDGGALIWALDQGRLHEIVTPSQVFRNTGNDKFFMQMEFGIAKKYVDDLSDNVKRGLRAKLERGWLPSLAPLGYRNDPVTRTVVPDPVLFPLIQKMWRLVASGRPPAEVLHRANTAWGLRTRQFKRYGGGPMARSVLYKILGNPFYHGLLVIKGQSYAGLHRPMLTKAEFDRVQELLGRPNRSETKRHEFAYSGLIRCGQCGASVTAEEQVNRYGRKYTYYHCTRRKGAADCRQPFLNAERLEEQIFAVLRRIRIPGAYLRWTLKEIEGRRVDDASVRITALRSLEDAHRALERKLDILTDLRLREVLDDEAFQGKRRALVQEELRLREQRAAFERKKLDWFESSQKAILFANQAASRFSKASTREKREIVTAVGSNLTLKDRILTISVHRPLLVMEEGRASPRWSGVVDGIRTFFLEHPQAIQWPRWVDEAVHTLTVKHDRHTAK